MWATAFSALASHKIVWGPTGRFSIRKLSSRFAQSIRAQFSAVLSFQVQQGPSTNVHLVESSERTPVIFWKKRFKRLQENLPDSPKIFAGTDDYRVVRESWSQAIRLWWPHWSDFWRTAGLEGSIRRDTEETLDSIQFTFKSKYSNERYRWPSFQHNQQWKFKWKKIEWKNTIDVIGFQRDFTESESTD